MAFKQWTENRNEVNNDDLFGILEKGERNRYTCTVHIFYREN